MRSLLLASFALVALAACTRSGTLPDIVVRPESIDVDGDGIPDVVDRCVTEKEDHLPPFPDDGCKVDRADPDGDGLTVSDKCPNAGETVNGFEDDDGCPDALPEVVVTREEIRCDARVLFATGKATIDTASNGLLDQVAAALVAHHDIDLVEVAGHADATGAASANVKLTRDRAGAVVEALVDRGVDPARLRPMGYGAYCPIAEGEDRSARDRNRRVDFKIVRRDGAPTGTMTGCSAAKKALASSR
jgi:outer membrane protein OmpA-like peptidoglycan-associated protein